MKKYPQIILLLLIILSGCKSNPEAYSTTYRTFKEKEEAMMEAKAKTTMAVPVDTMSNGLPFTYKTENFTLILGEEQSLLQYSIVSRSFINRTNAHGFYSQMVEKGYPAVLIQNDDRMYRIIIASFSTLEEAESKLSDYKKSFPDAYILFKAK